MNLSAVIDVQRAPGQGCSEKGSLWMEDSVFLLPQKTLATHTYREMNDLSLSASPNTQISDAQKHGADDVSKPMLTLT